jgi:cysteinyl-tRNA synthetase
VNINNEKMSKSLGNFFTIREILDKIHTEVLRLFVLSKHYRSPVDFSDDAIKESERGLERLYMTVSEALVRLGKEGDVVNQPGFKVTQDMKGEVFPSPRASMPLLLDKDRIVALSNSKAHTSIDAELSEKVFSFPEKFLEAMNNDFNTAQAVGLMFDLRNALQRFLETSGRKKLKGPAAELVELAVAFLRETGSILGILERAPEEFLQEQNLIKLKSTGMTVEEVEAWIARRAEARKEKRFDEADRIRAMLAEKSIQLEDTPQGTRWRVVGVSPQVVTPNEKV